MNTNLLGFSELSEFLNARHISFSCESGFSSVAIDSRNVKEGSLFYALLGTSCDGHGFVIDAFKAGAAGAVVESSRIESFDLLNVVQKYKKQLIVVDNHLKGLQDSALCYIKKFNKLKKIGITGSSGKSTTKEIAGAIISCEKNTVINKGNLNSDTGLPLSVFEIRDEHEVGIFELGMNRPGEISEIAYILKPNIALVTNIGNAHIEFFGTRENIFKEKKCVFKYLTNNDTALIPQDDEYAEKLAQSVTGNVKYYGAQCFKELEGIRSLGLDGTEIIWAGEKIHFALAGKHSLDDAMAAIAIAKEIPVSNRAIKQGLESVKPLFGRLEILKGRTTVIQDCYNANPQSTSRSIEFCNSVDWPARKIYVIADMLELGNSSKEEHVKIGCLLAESKTDGIFLFGSEIEAAAENLQNNNKQFFHTNDMETLSAALKRFVQPGDLVLLKGSRSCELERLTPMLTGDSDV
ncbi:MAG: UDP-N-acetylmuramoyl-tripeptide--D-alanyl-D-alanine ligase [Treponema sp.]|jgi:UDP-N-acetylmuramoyl-tripeptide--D-alanyl-D-alanine ligase|nr:UDP-N-acetylmuramoyl-tripeptide--D-alanyl-D-alanine ligase [Treponema sp.]